MLVDRFELSLDRIGGRFINAGKGLASQFSLERTEGPKTMTIAAIDDRAVGCALGHFKDGTPAYRALYLAADGSLSHGPERLLPRAVVEPEKG